MALQLQQFESQSISNRLKKTIDGIFSSPNFTFLQSTNNSSNNSNNNNNSSSNNNDKPATQSNSALSSNNTPSTTATSLFGFGSRTKSQDTAVSSQGNDAEDNATDTSSQPESVPSAPAPPPPPPSADGKKKTTGFFSAPQSLWNLKPFASASASSNNVKPPPAPAPAPAPGNTAAPPAIGASQQDPVPKTNDNEVATSDLLDFEAFVDSVNDEAESPAKSSVHSNFSFPRNDPDGIDGDVIEFNLNSDGQQPGPAQQPRGLETPQKRDSSSSAASSNQIIQNFATQGLAMKVSAEQAWSKFGGVFSSKRTPTASSAGSSLQSPSKPVGELLFPPVDSLEPVNESGPPIESCGSYDTDKKSSMHSEGDLAAASSASQLGEGREPRETTQILSKDLKTGSFIVPSSVLFRYPDNTDPPPVELCDFCMPIGAKLTQIQANKDDDNIIQDILFGYTHGKRSGRSFLFMIEDKTVDQSSDVTAGKIGRLYGICVAHPRFLRSNVVDPAKRLKRSKTLGDANAAPVSSNSNVAGPDGLDGLASSSSAVSAAEAMEFESLVCYAFITRFPFFDFFFQVLYDIIAYEKLRRFELSNGQVSQENNYETCKNLYDYLPADLLLDVLERLSKITPPQFGASLSFQMDQDLQTIVFQRMPFDQQQAQLLGKDRPVLVRSLSQRTRASWTEEYLASLSDWCLPALFSWVPPDILAWLLGLLLLETKVLVVGTESGLVSSVVLGLLTLIRPLDWVSPVIPMLPVRLLEFIESPVPILVGMVLDPLDPKASGLAVLKQCR